MSDRKKKMAVNRVPDLTPRRRPNGGIAIMNLTDHIVGKIFFNLENVKGSK